ncbi:CGNR zinc finger domain-containing protein [Streptomyces griseoaurantiacus]|uniref:CGNR zinc finger domain-containing protein n=1 Tax=Streptomyces griseoaurantiacus TaxID=68213 RepID=UPI0037993E0C
MSEPSSRVPGDRRPLTGEPLSLDLLNTRWSDEAGAQDLLDSAEGLGVWLRAAGLGAEAVADEATLAAVRETRDLLLDLVDTGSEAARAGLNRVLAHGAVRQELRPEGPRTRPEVDEAAWLPAWLAAADYLRLLTEAPDRVKRCAAHPRCVLHFHDTTKNGTRRWCSMAACGNRAKAARHYERSRGAARPGA